MQALAQQIFQGHSNNTIQQLPAKVRQVTSSIREDPQYLHRKSLLDNKCKNE